MRALHHKLVRNLREMKGQVFAIALVIICGVATFVMSLSTLDSLRLTQSTYYQDYHFADIFVSLKRAPESLHQRMLGIQGIDLVETRVLAEANLDIEGFPDPVRGQLISVPDEGDPLLNQLYIRQGRNIRPDHDDEVLVHEVFAQAHGFKPGDTLSVMINGRHRALTIAGIALSPEYVYQIAPGAMFPDFKHYGVLWMGRKALAAAYDMERAFNNAVLTLSAHARIGDLFILMMIIMAALIYGFWPKPLPVDTARVERGPLQVTIEEEGKTRVVDRYSISTPISGFSRRAEHAVRMARFDLEAARSALKYSASADFADGTRSFTLLSPVDGRVFKVHHKSGCR